MRKKMRTGIAMVELIFAIVILGIVMMSAPMLISTATTSGYVALQQEAIATAASEIGMILTHHWDEGDTDPTRSAPILGAAGDTDLDETFDTGLATGRRAGTPDSSKRTFSDSLGDRINASTVLGGADTDMDDIDDFSGKNSYLTDYEAAETTEGDTVDTSITILTTVTYISDLPTGAATYNGAGGTTLRLDDPFNTPAATTPSNIKHVRVSLTTTNPNEELDKTIVLNAFSCNIGTYKLNERTLP